MLNKKNRKKLPDPLKIFTLKRKIDRLEEELIATRWEIKEKISELKSEITSGNYDFLSYKFEELSEKVNFYGKWLTFLTERAGIEIKNIIDKFLPRTKQSSEIEFFIGTPPRNLLFTSFSNLCLRLRCTHLWNKFRKKFVKGINNPKCRLCGKKGKLYLHEPHRVDNKKLIFILLKPYLLCGDCHSKFDCAFGVTVRFRDEEVCFSNKKISQIVSSVKFLLKTNWLGKWLDIKEYKKQLQYLKYQLFRKNWNKNYKKIEFDKVYYPLMEDILTYFNGKYIKVYYLDAEKVFNVLKFLKKVTGKEFGCIIHATRTGFDELISDFPSHPYKIPLKILKKKVSVSEIIFKKSE